ncbi:MAG TPA: hypothetical protein VLY87_02545, partial [Flavobacterium sp.]|nr:hypothetical protein [Flavobacterium sp.]
MKYMNKYRFQFLVVLMSLALVGIILIQLYWISTTYENNDSQFQHRVNQAIGKVANSVKEKERYEFHKKYINYLSKTGKVPDQKEVRKIFYTEKNLETNEEIVYTNIISVQNLNDFTLNNTFIDSASGSKRDYKNYISRSKTEIFHGKKKLDDGLGHDIHQALNTKTQPDEVIVKNGNISELDKFGIEVVYNDVVSAYPIEERLSNESLQSLLKKELSHNKQDINFE